MHMAKSQSVDSPKVEKDPPVPSSERGRSMGISEATDPFEQEEFLFVSVPIYSRGMRF